MEKLLKNKYKSTALFILLFGVLCMCVFMFGPKIMLLNYIALTCIVVSYLMSIYIYGFEKNYKNYVYYILVPMTLIFGPKYLGDYWFVALILMLVFMV